MRSTERWPSVAPASAAAVDRFEELSRTFYLRLRSDRVRLTILSATLAQVSGDPTCAFEDIRLFAHRLRGAAMIFEVTDIGNAAHELEQAAGAASLERADNADPRVWAALEALVNRLAVVNARRLALSR